MSGYVRSFKEVPGNFLKEEGCDGFSCQQEGGRTLSVQFVQKALPGGVSLIEEKPAFDHSFHAKLLIFPGAGRRAIAAIFRLA